MNEYREKIEELKQVFSSSIETKKLDYRRSIIRALDYFWRELKGRNNGRSIEDMIDVVMKHLKIPLMFKTGIQKELEETQKQIAEVHTDYFRDATGNKNLKMEINDYEKMIALYQVDFPGLDKELRDIVVKEIRRGARANYGYEALRSQLQKRDLTAQEAATLANTSVAGFDNAYHTEMALQAGIEEFEYDGVLHENSRQFCREHIHNIYTIEELKAMDNKQGLPVETYLGGFNCSHFLTAVIKKRRKEKDENKEKPKSISEAIGGMFSGFYERAYAYKLEYETTVKEFKPGERANEKTKLLLDKLTKEEATKWLRDIKKKITTGEMLNYNRKDLNSDFKDHAYRFNNAITRDEYVEKANDIIKNAHNYQAQIYVNNKGEEQLQFLFFYNEGYAVVNTDFEIKGCYYHRDIRKSFNNIKKDKIWILNQGSGWIE